MYKYKRILVGLNLSDLDKTTIMYAGLISRMAKSEKAYFLYVNRNLSMPKNVLEQYPQLLRPLDEFAMEKMETAVNNDFDGQPQTKTVFEATEGAPLEEILRRTLRKEIDLIIVGRKKDTKETKRLPVKLARKAPCSVLVIPYEAKAEISKILVPVDFSESSADAMEIAIAFAVARNIPNITCLHVYNVPMAYYKTGKSYEEFAEIMKNNAEKTLQDFIRKFDLRGIFINTVFVLNKRPVNAIREAVERDKIDLVVIGTRGRSARASVILGSVTERLILTTQVPIIAVKKKGTGIKFFEALLKL